MIYTKTANKITGHALVAVHRRAVGSTRDQPRRLIQVEPIWTIATRAANAVRVHALSGFKSPSLRSSQALSPGIRGEGRRTRSAIADHWPGDHFQRFGAYEKDEQTRTPTTRWLWLRWPRTGLGSYSCALPRRRYRRPQSARAYA